MVFGLLHGDERFVRGPERSDRLEQQCDLKARVKAEAEASFAVGVAVHEKHQDSKQGGRKGMQDKGLWRNVFWFVQHLYPPQTPRKARSARR